MIRVHLFCITPYINNTFLVSDDNYGLNFLEFALQKLGIMHVPITLETGILFNLHHFRLNHYSVSSKWEIKIYLIYFLVNIVYLTRILFFTYSPEAPCCCITSRYYRLQEYCIWRSCGVYSNCYACIIFCRIRIPNIIKYTFIKINILLLFTYLYNHTYFLRARM